MNKRVVISGCSGGGKSTLLAELERRGFPVVEEPGRRVVQDQLRNHGTALPWVNLQAFLEKVVAVALDDIAVVNASNQWVFFDRGLVDAVIGLQYLTGEPVRNTPGLMQHYHEQAFLAPPWPQIYVQDNERRHDLDTAAAEYSRLLEAYPVLGYSVTILPKIAVAQRADFILRTLGA
tara:strand:+ start:17518 stop:18048 length:531 start_codon:yes stop_codon:yes gene_type:complete